MTRRWLLTAATALAVATAALATDLPSAWRAWRYSRAIGQSALPPPAFYKVHLAPAVFPHSQISLADLRIIDESGAEVPFVLSTESGGTKTESRGAEMRENSYVAGQYTQVLLDLGKQAAFHNSVKIVTPEQNFMNWVEVAASDDTRVWRIVKTRAPISRFRQENLDGNQTVHYSQNNARYLRLRILETSRQFPVSGVEVYFNSEVVEPAREAIPVTLVADPSAPSSVTRWNADFDGALYPISEIAFETRQPEFFRAVRVQTSEDGRDWNFCGSGEIYRYKVGDKLEESLRVPLYSWRSPRYWRIEVLNQNDAPLQNVTAQFVMHSRSLYFEQKVARPYRLIYGNPRATAPRYDLERLISVEARANAVIVRTGLGPEELTSDYSDPRPFTERHPNLLWIALAIAVLLLAYAAMRSLKSPTSPT
jgi:hypothetical protein